MLELRFTLGSTARRITYRFTEDGRVVLLTTFRKQGKNERAEIGENAQPHCPRYFPRVQTPLNEGGLS